MSEQQFNFKGNGNGRYGNGANFFASFFHCWFYNPFTNFSLCLLDNVYHVVFQLVIKFPYLDVTVVFFMYMDKLVCSNSDSNQESIREK